jgi:hypothetical protein
MDFLLVVAGGLVALVLFLFLAARWSTKSGPEILDWKPTRSYETEIQLEADEVEEMIRARNERRRRRGAEEVSEEDFRHQVQAAEREQKARSERYRAERADGG